MFPFEVASTLKGMGATPDRQRLYCLGCSEKSLLG